MLISIIIPVYKVEEYLRRCIDSVLEQTYTNLQIILVDDGSPDKCPKICDEYATRDARIEVIHQKNKGLSNARNTGLKIAKGDYVLFIDSDDFIAPNMCEKLLSAAKQKQADIVICNYKNYYSDGRAVIPEPFFKKTYTKIPCEDALAVAFKRVSFSVWNKLFKKELLKGFEFKEKVIRSEDVLATAVLFPKAKNIIYIPQALYYYFQNPKGATEKRDLLSRLETYNIVKLSLEECKKNNYNKVIEAAQSYYFDSAIIVALLILICDKQNKYTKVLNEIVKLGQSNKKNIFKSALSLNKKLCFMAVLICPKGLAFIFRISFINVFVCKLLRVKPLE